MLSLISTIARPPSGHLIRTKSSASLSVRCVSSPAHGYGGSCFVCRVNMTIPSTAERPVWYGFYRNRQCADECNPGRDLCWLLTRHPEKPEYHVVLCVRQEYFDGPELDRLILDARVTYWASRHRVKQSSIRSRSPGMWCWTVVHRTVKTSSKS